MRIILADDQNEVRSALRLLLEQEMTDHEVNEASCIQDLLHQVWGTCPDMVLLDWELPRAMGPNSLISVLRTLRPELKVVALSGRAEARQHAMTAGVDAFVSKGEPLENLLAALRKLPGLYVNGQNGCNGKNGYHNHNGNGQYEI